MPHSSTEKPVGITLCCNNVVLCGWSRCNIISGMLLDRVSKSPSTLALLSLQHTMMSSEVQRQAPDLRSVLRTYKALEFGLGESRKMQPVKQHNHPSYEAAACLAS